MSTYKIVSKLSRKPFFTVEDVTALLGIKRQSTWVLCSRYVSKGIFLRLKNNLYVLEQSWQNLKTEQFFMLANFLQVPSYISFATALGYYNLTTQIQRNFFESASLKRSAKFETADTVFEFHKLKKEYYFDFIRKDNFFIASPEKAFIDSVYLYSLGRYKMDFHALDLKKLDRKKLLRILKRFPEGTREAAEEICRI